MSTTRKEEREERRATEAAAGGAAGAGRSSFDQREQGMEAMSRSIDETKENIRRSTDEARKEMPRYAQTMTDLQSQTIDATREVSESFLDSQKEIINSMQSAWDPYYSRNIGGMAGMHVWAPWLAFSPREAAETYGRWISSVADYSVAATRMANNMMHAAMETTRISTNYAKDNAKEMSRVTGNAARAMSKTARESRLRDESR